MWVAHDVRDGIVDFIKKWSSKTELPRTLLSAWIGLSRSKYYDWASRYGKVNEHNALVPRDHWLEEWEKKAIMDYYLSHPLEGYRRLTLKGDCIRVKTPLSLEEARKIVEEFVHYCNNIRLHSAIGYIIPKDKLLGLEAGIFKERDRKLEEARERRRIKRQGNAKVIYCRWLIKLPGDKEQVPFFS